MSSNHWLRRSLNGWAGSEYNKLVMSPVEMVLEQVAQWRQRSDSPLSVDELRSWSHELGVRIHLAVMVEPYLSKICRGEKRIESRLTKVNISPFRRAEAGDVILFKLSGGPIQAVARVESTRFEDLSTTGLAPKSLANAFAAGLSYEPGYVETKAEARFVSLMWLEDVQRIDAISFAKPGRQAWVTLDPELGRHGRDASLPLF
jgi:hypothetical protein